MNSFNEELCSSDRSGRPGITHDVISVQACSSEDSKSLNVEQTHDRSGRLGKDTVAVQDDPEVYHEAETLNIDNETIRERIEADMDFKIPGLPHSIVKHAGNNFLHDRPTCADSWKTPWVTRFMSSDWALLEHLRSRCSRYRGHQTAVGKRQVTAAAAYLARLMCGHDLASPRRARPSPVRREGTSRRNGLCDLPLDAHDKPTEVDCAILQDHVKDEEEELQEYGSSAESMTSLRVSPSQQVWSRVQERRSVRHSWSIGECGKSFLCRSAGGGRGEDPLGPGGLT